jgi:hypothetical protein
MEYTKIKKKSTAAATTNNKFSAIKLILKLN